MQDLGWCGLSLVLKFGAMASERLPTEQTKCNERFVRCMFRSSLFSIHIHSYSYKAPTQRISMHRIKRAQRTCCTSALITPHLTLLSCAVT